MGIKLTPEQFKKAYDNGWSQEDIEATIKAHPDMDENELINKMITIVNPNLEEVQQMRKNELKDLETIKEYTNRNKYSTDAKDIWKRAQGKTKGIDVTPKGAFNKGVPAIMLVLDAMRNPQKYNEQNIQDINDVIDAYFGKKSELLQKEQKHPIATFAGEMLGYAPFLGETVLQNYVAIPAYVGATEAIAEGKDPIKGALAGIASAGITKGAFDTTKGAGKLLAKGFLKSNIPNWLSHTFAGVEGQFTDIAKKNPEALVVPKGANTQGYSNYLDTQMRNLGLQATEGITNLVEKNQNKLQDIIERQGKSLEPELKKEDLINFINNLYKEKSSGTGMYNVGEKAKEANKIINEYLSKEGYDVMGLHKMKRELQGLARWNDQITKTDADDLVAKKVSSYINENIGKQFPEYPIVNKEIQNLIDLETRLHPEKTQLSEVLKRYNMPESGSVLKGEAKDLERLESLLPEEYKILNRTKELQAQSKFNPTARDTYLKNKLFYSIPTVLATSGLGGAMGGAGVGTAMGLGTLGAFAGVGALTSPRVHGKTLVKLGRMANAPDKTGFKTNLFGNISAMGAGRSGKEESPLGVLKAYLETSPEEEEIKKYYEIPTDYDRVFK